LPQPVSLASGEHEVDLIVERRDGRVLAIETKRRSVAFACAAKRSLNRPGFRGDGFY
jgi:hypothetical protein